MTEMDEKERQSIIEAKDKWLMAGNISGAAVCCFLLIKDRGLDIVYNAENELVREYRELLRKRLETDNDRLLLMVSTEIERCLIDEKEELCTYLSDEIYEHFQNGGNEYPIQAVWLHIDIINTLFYSDYEEKGGRYMHIIRDTQKEVFGDESFLFCRNWCYIINEALRRFISDAAIIEFDRNVDLFSKVLKEEDILYQLCVNIAIDKMKQEQNADHLKYAIDLCEMWCRDIPLELQRQKQALIRIMRAVNYRNIGELDMAVEMFQEEMSITENIQYKLYLMSHIASILFTKGDLNMFPSLLEKGEKLAAAVQEPDKYVAEFYNICGLYYMMKGMYDEAISQFDKAISISEKIKGWNEDEIVKLKYHRLMAEYETGKLNAASKQINQLFQTIRNSFQYYPQSFPLVSNGMLMLKMENNIDSDTVKRIKNYLNDNQNKYDIISVLLFKSNLYYLMMASEDIYDRDDWESIQRELEAFFNRYPNAEGRLQYLKGEYYRCLQEEDSSSVNETAGRILDKIEIFLAKIPHIVTSMNYFHYYYIKLRNLLYKKDYIAAKRQLLSMRKNIIMPLFETLSHMKEDTSEDIFFILNSYASLFVSAVQQYPKLRISEKVLYEFVLNIKYFEDLFYCSAQEFYYAVEQKIWLSEADINIDRKELVIECFDYVRNDMTDIRNVFRNVETDLRALNYRIYFGIQFSSVIFPKRIIEVISDVSCMKIQKRMSDLHHTYDINKISEIEQVICDRLHRFIYKKKRIFYCRSSLDMLMPLAFIRQSKDQYLGDMYQIIYCNTAKDIRDDVSVQDISKSIFFGMSKFDGDKENHEIHQKLDDLPYAELEVEVLGELTGGVVCLNEKKPKEWFNGQRAEIIHFATHTLKDKENDSVALIIEKDGTASYNVLQDKDISKMNWKGVKLAVFSGCETGGEEWDESGKRSLRLAAKRAGTLFSISTFAKISDGTGSFFMVYFYKNLLRYGKICEAYFETQKMMRTMTKKEILNDDDYVNIGMEFYLQNIEDDSKPFDQTDDWALYLLQMN